jgi:septation ring formation regulator EzrA
MRKSIVTGETICKEINSVKKELDEIGMGMDEVDRDSVAYSILKKAYDEKRQELRKIETTKYVLHEEKDFTDGLSTSI